MHPDCESALDQIDAMMFSGDPDNDDLITLETFISRWQRAIISIRNINGDTE